MTEAELQAEVIAECERFGLLWHHCPFGRRCDGSPGLPDLIIAGERGVIFRELKTEAGQTSADQDRWAWDLTRPEGGFFRWGIWRPSDLESGRIKDELGCLR